MNVPTKRHKYGANPAWHCGDCGALAEPATVCLACGSGDIVRFASKREGARWQELCLMRRAGEISTLERQPRYRIVVNGRPVCTYVADFRYEELGGVPRVEDVKGMDTPVSRLKRKLMKACHDIDVIVVR